MTPSNKVKAAVRARLQAVLADKYDEELTNDLLNMDLQPAVYELIKSYTDDTKSMILDRLYYSNIYRVTVSDDRESEIKDMKQRFTTGGALP